MGNPAERFICAPGLRLEAHRALTEQQFQEIARSLTRLEVQMERLERRLWLAVFGMVASVLAAAGETLLAGLT